MAYAEKRGNTWRARWKVPGTEHKYDSKSGFRTKEQALDYGEEQEVDIRRGDYVDRRDGEILLSEWAEEWIETLDVAPESEYGYRKRLNGVILPRWGDLSLSHITTNAYLVWEKQVKARYSENYARNVLVVFRMLMDDAVAHRPPLLKQSPVPAVNRRRGKYQPKPKPEAVIGTPAQVLELAENARTVWGPAGYVAILTKAYCGLRQGELCGLRREWCYPYWPWSDPGWDDNPEGRQGDRRRQRAAMERYGRMPALRVQWQHQYVQPPGGGPRVPTLTDPKYGSRRDLVLPPFLAGLIAELLEEHDSEWVFPSATGSPLLLTDFSTYYWQPILNGAEERTGRYARPKVKAVEGLEGMVPHGLRHGMKVWLDEGGQHSRVAVEERMGHRLQGVEGVYSHVTPAMERRIAVDLQGMWVRSQSGG